MYYSTVCSDFTKLNSFLRTANSLNYTIVAMTESPYGFFTIIYKM